MIAFALGGVIGLIGGVTFAMAFGWRDE